MRTLGNAVAGSSTFLTGLAIALVALTDRLFYGHGVGCNAAILAGAAWICISLRTPQAARRRSHVLLSAAIVGLTIALILDSTILGITMTCLCIVVLAISARLGWSSSLSTWFSRLCMWLIAGWCWLACDCATGVRRLCRHPESRSNSPIGLLRLAWRWVVPVLLSGGFLFLFSLANPVVEHWVDRARQRLVELIVNLPDLFDAGRVLFWLATLVASWSLLRVHRRFLGSRARQRTDHPLELPPGADLPLGGRDMVVRCLILFNVVFGMETILDVLYLWGGRTLPHGMSFKEYAHRGAYPLIATALLAGAFVLLAFRRECRDPGWQAARRLVYCWIAQNILLTFSAGWRLMLLVNASNLTRWRLATAIWLGLVAAGLASLIWRIVSNRDNGWLLRANFSLAIMTLYVCCFLNLDGFIADYNAAHCLDVARNGDPLGLTYLKDLGVTSIPALERLSHTLDTPGRRDMAARLAGELRQQLAMELKDWRAWTVRRAQIDKETTGRSAGVDDLKSGGATASGDSISSAAASSPDPDTHRKQREFR